MMRIFAARQSGVAAGILTILVSAGQITNAGAQAPGEQSFQTICAPCHTIGGGRLVGPDLAGVNDRRSQQWLETFLKSPQAMIKSGDADAVALFDQYKVLMPDPPLAAEQISEVLSYLRARSLAGSPVAGATDTGAAPAQSNAAVPASPEEIAKGQDLFQGHTRFANRGPACNSCHEVKNDAVIGGGILARELTTVFSRMGGPGVTAILGQAPFPVMQAAYKNHGLTQDEVTSLVAFLQDADARHAFQQPRQYGMGLFIGGMIGAGILFVLFATIWRKRKTGSVYQAIFDRQMKSVSDKAQ
jgi:cytochrome c2